MQRRERKFWIALVSGLLVMIAGAGVMVAAIIDAHKSADPQRGFYWLVALLLIEPLCLHVGRWLREYGGAGVNKHLGLPARAVRSFEEILAELFIFYASLAVVFTLLVQAWIGSVVAFVCVCLLWSIRKGAIRNRYLRAELAERRIDEDDEEGRDDNDDDPAPEPTPDPSISSSREH